MNKAERKRRKELKKQSKVTKGGPSGLIVSIIVHAAAFFAAGIFVVFKVLPKPEPVFEPPPPIQRPKMNLKKPKVKVQKSSTPKPSSRIVAKVKTANMPEIALPDVMGTGEGLLGGLGGLGGDFMEMPDIGTVTAFGKAVSAGTDLEVTFYCLARNRDGSANSKMDHKTYYAAVRDFVRKGWRKSVFARYYRSQKKLYAPCIAIPIVTSMVGPISFGETDYVLNARCWAAHYKGKIISKDGITFRLWGAADDVLTVAIDKEVALAANFSWDGVDAYTIADDWSDRAPGSRSQLGYNTGVYRLGNDTMVGSGWITLEPGKFYDFDAVVGEGPGGEFFSVLLCEIKGEKYPKNEQGTPIFPLFALEPLSWDLQDNIIMNMRTDEFNVTNITHYFYDE